MPNPGATKVVSSPAVLQNEHIVSVTSKAAEKLKEFMKLENKEGYGLRIAVYPGGCSGYQTTLTFEKSALESDVKYEVSGVPIYVDKGSEMYLHGSVVDYVEGLHGSGFTVNNPNAKGSCGCGSSQSY